jgi:hypothetical protein
VLLDSLAEYITSRYTDPARVLPYETREGGYQGVFYDGHELILDLASYIGEDDLVEDVAMAFAGSAWCDKDYFTLKEDEQLQFGWEAFVEQVLHHTRYLFLQELGEEDEYDESIPPGRMLDALGSLFLRFDLLNTLASGASIVRARVHDSDRSLETAEELGPPDREATVSNRMSPSGIAMFYGAMDDRTAIAETYDPNRRDDKAVTLATFLCQRDLLMLDLTSLPEIPSPFDRENRELRRPLGFLHGFVRDLVRPITRDGSERLEYVPTQVVTEFVRHRFKTTNAQRVDGILYRSSKAAGGTAVVIFAGPDQCGAESKGILPPEPLLALGDHRSVGAAELALA